MEDKEWFASALDELLRVLSEKTEVNGLSFLEQYLNENWPSELKDDISDEEFDDYVNINVDDFEVYIKDRVSIRNDYYWSSEPQSYLSDIEFEKPELEAEYKELLAKTTSELTPSDLLLLSNVRDQLNRSGSFEQAYLAALNVASCFDDDNSIAVNKKADAWERVADISTKLDDYRDNADRYYSKAASYRLALSDYLLSADLFYLSACHSTNYERKLNYLRRARVLYSDSGLNEKASLMYVDECELVRSNSKGWDWFKRSFYKKLSNYGESPWYVLGWIGFVIFSWAILYYIFDINTPGLGIYECTSDLVSSIATCAEVSNSEPAHPLTHLYFSFVTFTTLGYGDFSPTENYARFFASIQAVLGLALSSLFIATFLRKFSR